MYKIKMLCFDSKIGAEPYEDAPLNPYFHTEEEAYAKALELAEGEAEDLNKECDKNVSFGVVEDEKDNSIRVLYYYMDEPTDTTGNTEQVTTYWVEEVNEEERLKQILAVKCNRPVINEKAVRNTYRKIFEQRLQDASVILDKNIDEIIRHAEEMRGR